MAIFGLVLGSSGMGESAFVSGKSVIACRAKQYVMIEQANSIVG
jgi:hypothetical protein